MNIQKVYRTNTARIKMLLFICLCKSINLLKENNKDFSRMQLLCGLWITIKILA